MVEDANAELLLRIKAFEGLKLRSILLVNASGSIFFDLRQSMIISEHTIHRGDHSWAKNEEIREFENDKNF